MYKRFWINEKINGDMFLINDEEHNHISNVLRLRVGEKIIVNCGDKYDYLCEIIDITKKFTKCKVLSIDINKHNPNININVFQALIKNDKMSILTQKLNEIGVTNLVLFESKNQTVKPSDNKQEKLQKISDQSAKQCKRSISMKVSKVISFKDMVKCIKEYDLVIFANETEDSVLLNSLVGKIENYDNIAIIIGSEGGFEPYEIDEIVNAGAVSVSLGKRILRAETASITLSSFVSFLVNN